MPKASKAGYETYWTTYGQGPRQALMIHCALASSAAWGRMARHLSGALTMTAFDMPDHGRSAALDPATEIQGATTRIAAHFLDAPTDIIGHSFGASVALRLAVEQPELVRTLTLIEPVIFAVAAADQPQIARDHAVETAEYTAAMESADYWEAARAFTELWGDGTSFQTLGIEQQRELARQMVFVGAGMPALYHDVGQILVPERLSRVAMPVLLIEGSTSPGIIGAICEGLKRRLPDASRTIIAGAGHMAPITHAGQVSAEVLRFLRA